MLEKGFDLDLKPDSLKTSRREGRIVLPVSVKPEIIEGEGIRSFVGSVSVMGTALGDGEGMAQLRFGIIDFRKVANDECARKEILYGSRVRDPAGTRVSARRLALT